MSNSLLNMNKQEDTQDTQTIETEFSNENSATAENKDADTVADSPDNELPTEEDIKNITPNEDGIINIDMTPIKKKRFCINGDLDKVLELNIADINIVSRLSTALKKLQNLQQEASNVTLTTSDSESLDIEVMANTLTDIDTKMRELVDYIFNAPVSEVCADDGSMYDVFKGTFRYEHIIETLMRLYQSNIKVEYNNMRTKVSKHTNKYTKKRN